MQKQESGYKVASQSLSFKIIGKNEEKPLHSRMCSVHS